MTEPTKSTPVGDFEEIYKNNADPWSYTWLRTIKTAFSSHFYERRRYWRTMRILPRQRFRNVLEIGCSIGVFTRSLSRRCERLLALDYSPTALALARERCRTNPQVQFLEACVPRQFPDGSFDLIVFSEVAYYLSPEDFIETARKILSALSSGGYLVMVHYRHHRDLPTSGDFAHDWFLHEAGPQLKHLKDWRRPSAYRLDLFQKTQAK